MREADNISWSIFLSVVGVYVVRTSSLNDKHSCQLFRKASSLVLLSSSDCRHGQPKLFARDHFLQSGFSSTSPRFNLLRVDSVVFYFHFRVLSSILSLSFLCSSVSEALFTLSFSYLSERFFFVHDKAALARSRNQWHGCHRSVFTTQKWLWACAWAT